MPHRAAIPDKKSRIFKLNNLRLFCFFCASFHEHTSIQFPNPFCSLDTVFDCFYSSRLSLTSAVGFTDLNRLTCGGFAAGSSFSLMREMEQFLAFIHFHTRLMCVFKAVCVLVHAGGVCQYLCLWFGEIARVKYGVCLSQHVVCVCAARRFVFEH